LREPFLQLLFRGVKREITDVKLLHLRTPSVRNLATIAERTEESKPPGGGKPRECHAGGADRFSGPVHGLENCPFLQPQIPSRTVGLVPDKASLAR
jgi:hypothetical protein